MDSTPPLPGSVTDGRPGEELDVQIESSVLRASWVNFTEQETRIVSYQLAFGTFPRRTRCPGIHWGRTREHGCEF